MPAQYFGQLAPQQPNPLGQALGQGLGQFAQRVGQQQQQQQQAGILSRVLSGQASQEEMAQLDPQTQLELAKLQAQSGAIQSKQLKAQEEQAGKLEKEAREAEILAKYQLGQDLTPQEMSELSPTSLRALIHQDKPTFEPTEEKLEAERVSKLASEIESGYEAFQAEEMRLNRMENLSEKGQLSTPLMAKGLEALNLPLGVLGNPDTEEYAKLQADFLRDVRNVFPGGRITNYEIQSYLKTVPTLMNSAEGKKAIIRNRRLQNEAKKLKYDAYRDVLKENKGRKPRNMGLLIDEKIGGRMAAIENEFKEGIQSEIQKFQQPVKMKDAQGRSFDIPPNMIEKALQDGFSF